MKSHHYHGSTREALTILGGPVLAWVAWCALVHILNALQGFPSPRAMRNTDQTVLVHQAEASRSAAPSDWLLVGDSSCLMDVSAPQLENLVGGGRVLNLGCLSYLPMETWGRLVEEHHRRHPTHPNTVVILVHPEFLRGVEPVPQFAERIEAHWAGRDYIDGARIETWWTYLSGTEIVRGRLWDRWFPRALPGAFGSAYGFTQDLARFMTDHQGSAIDPNRFSPSSTMGSTEYRLAARLEEPARRLAAALNFVPRVVAGITPIPESLAPRDYATRAKGWLAEWASWLDADIVLTNLPAMMPDTQFASPTHLDAQGQSNFTARLAAEYARLGLTQPGKRQ